MSLILRILVTVFSSGMLVLGGFDVGRGQPLGWVIVGGAFVAMCGGLVDDVVRARKHPQPASQPDEDNTPVRPWPPY